MTAPVTPVGAALVELIRAIVREELAAAPASAPPPQEWFSVKEAAEYLRISKRMLERLVASGEVRSTTAGRRRIVRREWLDEYAAAGEEVAPTTPPRRRGTTVRSANHSLGGQHAR
jgi:excisionase family DNA binding protein